MLTLVKIRSNLAKFSLQVQTLQGQTKQKNAAYKEQKSMTRSNSRTKHALEKVPV